MEAEAAKYIGAGLACLGMGGAALGLGGRFFRSDDHFCVVFVRSRRGSRFCDGRRGRASAPKSVRLGPKSRSASMGWDILPLLSRGDGPRRSWCARAAPSRPESARTAALVVTLGRRHAAGRTVCAGRTPAGTLRASRRLPRGCSWAAPPAVGWPRARCAVHRPRDDQQWWTGPAKVKRPGNLG